MNKKKRLRQRLAFWSKKQVPQKNWELAGSKAIFGAVSMALTARSKTQIHNFILYKIEPYFGVGGSRPRHWTHRTPMALEARTMAM